MEARAREGASTPEPTPVRLVPEFIGSLLVLAPHPDDETIAAGGLLRAVARAGGRVRVVVLSDGAASHPGSAVRPATLAALRRTETLSAMARLGVPGRFIHFCDFSDGSGPEWASDPSGLSRLSAATAGAWDAVCLPSQLDHHPDHRATRELGLRVAGQTPLRLAYTVWADEGAHVPVHAEYALPQDALRAKREALRLYRSQMGLIADDPTGFVIDEALFARFCAPSETFQIDA